MPGPLQKVTLTQNFASPVNIPVANVGTIIFTVIPNGATCTLFTAVDASGTFVANSCFTNFTSTVQGETQTIGKFGITISNIQPGGVVIEYKQL